MSAARWDVLGAVLAVYIVAAPASARAFCLCTCTVDVPSMSFGAINPLAGAATDTTGTVTVACGSLAVAVSYDIRLSRGASGSYAARTMTNGGATLTYNLYRDAARSQIWGDGSGGSGVVSDAYLLALGGSARSYTIYGRAPAAPTAVPGAYSDTITATVVY